MKNFINKHFNGHFDGKDFVIDKIMDDELYKFFGEYFNGLVFRCNDVESIKFNPIKKNSNTFRKIQVQLKSGKEFIFKSWKIHVSLFNGSQHLIVLQFMPCNYVRLLKEFIGLYDKKNILITCTSREIMKHKEKP